MLTRAAAVLLAVLVLTGAAPAQSSSDAAPTPAKGEEVRIYDTSDLPQETDLQAVARFVPLSIGRLTSSLVIVAAQPEDHERLRAILGQLRGLTPPRIALGAVVHRVADASGVQVGEPAGPAVMEGPVVRRAQIAGTRRTSLLVRSLESITYVQDLTPVVGSSAAALDPEIGTAKSGLEISVVVGDADSGVSPVTIAGTLTTATLPAARVMSTPSAGVYAGPKELDLVSTTERPLNAALRAPEGQTIVAAVVDDPENPGAALVLTISVTPAP